MSVRSRIYPFLSILFRPVSLFPLPPLPSPLPVEKFTFFRENGLSSNSRSTSLPRVFAQWTCVCVCVCTSVRMQQRSRQVNITVGTKQRELVRADVKWPTFLADSELDSFYTFCSPSLVPPFNPTYPPFLFLPYSSPNFLPRLFLPFTLPLLVSLILVAVCRKATRFTRRFSRGIQNENKSNNQKGRVVSRLVKVCREENQRTLMREVIDCSFLSLFFL